MSQQPEQNKTAEQILETHVKYRQVISIGNYSCVGIPYEDALKAVKHASEQTASLQKQVEEQRKQWMDEAAKEAKKRIDQLNFQQERIAQLEEALKKMVNATGWNLIPSDIVGNAIKALNPQDNQKEK